MLQQLIPLFPKHVNNFVDLFCGGCNVGINIEAENYLFNDNLTFLIDLYRSFLSNPTKEILCHVESRIADFELSLTNTAGYISLRKEYNTNRNPLDLFVLIAYSFNHQIRFNNKHEFNNPFGKERSSFNERMKRNLIRFVDKMHVIQPSILSLNFDDVDLSHLSTGDFVYADPPYLITTGTYNDGKRGFTGWGNSHELALLNLLESIDNQGALFALSNVITHKGKDNCILRQWVNDTHYNVHILNKHYNNSNYQSSKTSNPTVEVLITNY